MDLPGIFPDEFESNAESTKGPGPCLINDPGEVNDESYPHRTTQGAQRTPVARALSPEPPDPDIARAKTLAQAARSGKPSGHHRLGAPMVGCPDGDPRCQDGPRRAGAHVGMPPAHQRGGAANRRRPAALGSVAGRLPARRQPPAGPGPEPNSAVTRAGGRGPRCRPRHCQRIRQQYSEPPDRHQLQREPSHVPPRRRPANVRSSPLGKNTPGTSRPRTHLLPRRSVRHADNSTAAASTSSIRLTPAGRSRVTAKLPPYTTATLAPARSRQAARRTGQSASHPLCFRHRHHPHGIGDRELGDPAFRSRSAIGAGPRQCAHSRPICTGRVGGLIKVRGIRIWAFWARALGGARVRGC